MRTKFSGFLTLLLAFVVQITFAQEKTVSGTVTDEEGLPLPGVNVIIQGTESGTQTDFDGNFSIETEVGEVLEFSFVGLTTQEITVGQSNTLDIVMVSNAEALGEVVVQAYRTTTQKKSNVASSTVTASTIEGRPNANFIQTLQSQVPGLNIQTGSGQPGASSTVVIRGIGSINGSIEPLYVIDGVPQNGDNFRSLNPNEIASISVLKDAGATAIYGNRGANGVIIVETKRGSYNSDLEITYIGTTGFTQIQGNDYDLLDARGLLRLENQQGVGRGSTLTEEEINNYDVNTDWNDYFFRTGVSQSHTLNLSSGSKNLSSFTSIGYFNQEGILENTDLNRFTFRNNLNGKSDNGKFSYGTSLSVNFSKRNEATSLGTGGVNQNYVLGANNSAPYISPSTYTGSEDLLDLYNSDGTLLYTPLMLIDKLNTFSNEYQEIKSIANVNASYKITDNLTASTRFGLDYTQNVRSVFQSGNSFNSFLFLDPGQEFGGTDSNSMSRQMIANSTTQLSYTNTFDKHSIEVSAFTEYVKAHLRGFGFTQTGLDPKSSAPYAGTGYIGYDGNPYYVPSVNANKTDAGLFSYFGYADYDYDTTFGFSGTLRRDASYRFNTTNRWGTFWSVSGRWNLEAMDFMNGSAFDVLKLRASYGKTGNQNILGESIFAAPNASRDIYGSTPGYANNQALGIFSLGNDTLKWEEIFQANIGIDYELFNSRIRGSFDVYQKTTKDLYQSVGLSAINAITEIDANFGELRNRGVELAVKGDVIRNDDLRVTLNFNGSYNENEIVDVPSETGTNWDGESLTAITEGRSLNEYYVLKYAGVNPVNGNLLFYDADGNLTENPDPAIDRQYTGENFFPKFQGGFGFDIDYKGFYATSLFSFVTNTYRYDYDYSGLVDPSNIGIFNLSEDILRAWTPENTSTDIPALNASNRDLEQFSDRFLKDASYLRMRYLTVGYNFQPQFLENTFLKSAKVFAQGENLFTWTKWRGWDAESNRSADQYQYPTPRIYSIGLELKF